jgi:uncharacterized protein
MKKIIGVMLVLALVLVASGRDGGGASTPAPPKAPGKTFLNIVTSTTGGTFYAVGGNLAYMITKYIPNTQATAEATAGGVENARLIKNKQASLATMPGDTLYNAVNGISEFKDDGKIAIFQIAALYETPLQIVTMKKLNIKSIKDLKGKRVSIGAPGSSTAIRAEIVLQAHGLTLKDIKPDSTTSTEAANQMMDGRIDAAFFASGAPMAAIMGIAAQDKIVMLSVEPAAMAKIEKEHPDLIKIVLKAGVYQGVDTETVCVANMAILSCRPDLSQDLVYQITKMIFEKKDEFVAAHKSLAVSFNEKTAISQGNVTPFHPGALKYYKEKGLLK